MNIGVYDNGLKDVGQDAEVIERQSSVMSGRASATPFFNPAKTKQNTAKQGGINSAPKTTASQGAIAAL